MLRREPPDYNVGDTVTVEKSISCVGIGSTVKGIAEWWEILVVPDKQNKTGLIVRITEKLTYKVADRGSVRYRCCQRLYSPKLCGYHAVTSIPQMVASHPDTAVDTV